MSQVGPGYLRIVAGGEEVARYAFTGSEFTTERAVMLGDFYLKDVWRFAAVGQGFDGGLDALLKNFGGEVAEEEPRARPQPQPGAAPGFAPPAPAPRAAPGARAPPAPAARPGLRAAPGARAAARPGARSRRARRAHHRGALHPAGAARSRRPRSRTVASPRPAAPPPRYGQPPPGQAAPASRPATASRPGAPPGYGQPPPYGQVPGSAARPVRASSPPARRTARRRAPRRRGAGLAAALQQYKETPTGQRWTPQNKQLIRVDLGIGGQPVLARQGSMVLYQGKVDFGYKGAGFAGRIVGNATGQEMQLMRCTGQRPGLPRRERRPPAPHRAPGRRASASPPRTSSPSTSPSSTRSAASRGTASPAAPCSPCSSRAPARSIVKTHGTPVVLPVTPTTFADCNAVVAWSAASQVIVSSQVRLRRNAYPGHSGETVNLQFRGAPGNFIVVQPYEV